VASAAADATTTAFRIYRRQPSANEEDLVSLQGHRMLGRFMNLAGGLTFAPRLDRLRISTAKE